MITAFHHSHPGQARRARSGIQSWIPAFAGMTLVCAFTTPGYSESCIKYGEQVTLQGKIGTAWPCPSSEHPGLSQKECDYSMAPRLVAALDKSVCVANGTKSTIVKEFELDYPGHNPSLRNTEGDHGLIGQNATISGKMYRPGDQSQDNSDIQWATDYIVKVKSLDVNEPRVSYSEIGPNFALTHLSAKLNNQNAQP